MVSTHILMINQIMERLYVRPMKCPSRQCRYFKKRIVNVMLNRVCTKKPHSFINQFSFLPPRLINQKEESNPILIPPNQSIPSPGSKWHHILAYNFVLVCTYCIYEHKILCINANHRRRSVDWITLLLP